MGGTGLSTGLSTGFRGGDVAVVGRAGEELARAGDDVAALAAELRAALARAAGAVGHRAAAAALEAVSLTWCGGLVAAAAQVTALGAAASAGAADLRRAGDG
ncbi:hypothetical protein D9V37_11440 [Nocardioides mangrovicus]|uniref:Uncharacterized protein n=1 Tax=Nocardioides mangrovicus TaxID=2478913 RepID=A0A3L8P1H6_9ACTN|nr:hypothetical protein [Nocardioides mangrovicus]RLV49165.1 hypothetical protein D9V37_11440 [Nocardioides mangrovicus]